VSRVATSKSQNWLLWFTEVDRQNSRATYGGGHEFSKDFAFTPDWIAANCTRCGQFFASRYGKETGPFNTDGAWSVSRCDDALAVYAERETKEEVTK
jgi:hypothetical protein